MHQTCLQITFYAMKSHILISNIFFCNYTTFIFFQKCYAALEGTCFSLVPTYLITNRLTSKFTHEPARYVGAPTWPRDLLVSNKIL